MKIVLSPEEAWALDLTAGKRGFKEVIIPWNLFKNRTIEEVCSGPPVYNVEHSKKSIFSVFSEAAAKVGAEFHAICLKGKDVNSENLKRLQPDAFKSCLDKLDEALRKTTPRIQKEYTEKVCANLKRLDRKCKQTKQPLPFRDLDTADAKRSPLSLDYNLMYPVPQEDIARIKTVVYSSPGPVLDMGNLRLYKNGSLVAQGLLDEDMPSQLPRNIDSMKLPDFMERLSMSDNSSDPSCS